MTEQFIELRDITPRREFIKGEVTYEPVEITGIPREWRDQLEAVEPNRNVRLTEGKHILFEGTAGELLANLD